MYATARLPFVEGESEREIENRKASQARDYVFILFDEAA